MAAFTLDTSGFVQGPPAGVRTKRIYWPDLSPLEQGYVEAMFESLLAEPRLWRVSYEGRWFGAMKTRTPLEALAKVRKDNGAHIAGRFHVQSCGFSDLAPETLSAIRKDCAARFSGWVEHPNNAYVRADDKTEGARFWRDRQSGGCRDFPSLTVSLGDDGKVRFL